MNYYLKCWLLASKKPGERKRKTFFSLCFVILFIIPTNPNTDSEKEKEKTLKNTQKWCRQTKRWSCTASTPSLLTTIATKLLPLPSIRLNSNPSFFFFLIYKSEENCLIIVQFFISWNGSLFEFYDVVESFLIFLIYVLQCEFARTKSCSDKYFRMHSQEKKKIRR